ncbi:MAG: zinc ribbon domain-containing protein [Deltaproteobacteria bacterium]|nr:zinc ribbon domain-containing protein [Candidatus Zymogenaceae bacterium]
MMRRNERGLFCPSCGAALRRGERFCPRCGHEYTSEHATGGVPAKAYRGFQWRTEAEILGWPVVHVAFGRDAATGKVLVARGLIAVGQFGVGLVTVAQVGVGVLFAFGQCVAGIVCVGQLALGALFGLGQFATGQTAIGQFAFGEYILAQIGWGKYMWTQKVKDPEAIAYFTALWRGVKAFFGA